MQRTSVFSVFTCRCSFPSTPMNEKFRSKVVLSYQGSGSEEMSCASRSNAREMGVAQHRSCGCWCLPTPKRSSLSCKYGVPKWMKEKAPTSIAIAKPVDMHDEEKKEGVNPNLVLLLMCRASPKSLLQH